jgi:hypothetical protein
VCIILSLFTRFFAAALAIELAIALLVVHLKAGFAVSRGATSTYSCLALSCSRSRCAAGARIRLTVSSGRNFETPRRGALLNGPKSQG